MIGFVYYLLIFMKQLLILVSLLVILSSCASKTPPVSETPAVQTPEVQTSTWTEETSTMTWNVVTWGNGGYMITVPEAFKADPEKGDVLDISYIDEEQRMSLFTVTEPKDGVQVSSLEEYVDIVMENFKGLTKNALVDTIKNSQGYTVLDKKYTWNFQGEDVIMYTRLVDTGTEYVQIIAATDPAKFDDNVQTMLDMIDSFTLKK